MSASCDSCTDRSAASGDWHWVQSPSGSSTEIGAAFKPCRCDEIRSAVRNRTFLVVVHGFLSQGATKRTRGVGKQPTPLMRCLLFNRGQAPSIFVGVTLTRSPSRRTWSAATGCRLTRIK